MWRGGWRVGGIVNARSGVPINVIISRADNATVNGATVTNIPGGNSRGTQRPDVVPDVDPYLKDGVRWLNPAAFTTPLRARSAICRATRCAAPDSRSST